MLFRSGAGVYGYSDRAGPETPLFFHAPDTQKTDSGATMKTEIEDEQKEIEIVKRKKFELEPMTVEEAIMQMELLQHNFFVFLNLETDTVAVAYKRNNSNYGVLETSY